MAKRQTPKYYSNYLEEYDEFLSQPAIYKATEDKVQEVRLAKELSEFKAQLNTYKRIVPGYIETFKTIEQSLITLSKFNTKSDEINAVRMEDYKKALTNIIAATKYLKDGLIDARGRVDYGVMDSFVEMIGQAGGTLFFSGRGFQIPTEESSKSDFDYMTEYSNTFADRFREAEMHKLGILEKAPLDRRTYWEGFELFEKLFEPDESEGEAPESEADINRTRWRSEFLKTMEAVNGVISSIASVFKRAVIAGAELSDIATPLVGDFTDIVDAITRPLLGTLDMAAKGLTGSLSVMNGFASSTGMILKTLLGSEIEDDKKEDKEGKGGDDTSKSGKSEVSILNVIANSISTIIQVFSMGFQAILVTVTAGISLFFALFQSLNSFFKQIASTSPVFQQILNIANLALIMFFLPFVNYFANTLFSYVIAFAVQMRDWGLIHSSNFESIIGTAESMGSVLESIVTELSAIGERLMEVFVPLMFDLLILLSIFSLYFIETLLSNSEQFIELLKEGIEAASQMLKANLLGFLLKFGTDAMAFLSLNMGKIHSIFKAVIPVIEVALNLMVWVMDHFWAFCMMLGGAIVSLLALATLGAMVSKSLVETLLSKGGKEVVKLFGSRFVKAGLGGFGLGAGIGLALWYVLFGFEQFAKGGYIPPIVGGMYAIVAEKETEYIIPKSKVHMIRGHNNLVIEFTGTVVGTDDFNSDVRGAMSRISHASRYR